MASRGMELLRMHVGARGVRLLGVFVALCLALRIKAYLRRKRFVPGQVALVTGGCMGIGKRVSTLLAKKWGMTVVVWDIRDDLSSDVLNLIAEAGGHGHFQKVDITNPVAVADAFSELRSLFGRVDLLINNAGVVHGKAMLDIDDRSLYRVFGVNTFAPLYVWREVLPLMMKQGRGHVVTVASAASFSVISRNGDYCASKHAVYAMHTALRLELKQQGYGNAIDTMIVCPMAINTGMFQGYSQPMPWLFPTLDEKTVASKIVDGIEWRKELAVLPRHFYVLLALQTLLPISVADALYTFFDKGQCMENFVGRGSS